MVIGEETRFFLGKTFDRTLIQQLQTLNFSFRWISVVGQGVFEMFEHIPLNAT